MRSSAQPFPPGSEASGLAHKTMHCLGADAKPVGAHGCGLSGECSNPVYGFGGGMLRSHSQLIRYTISWDDGGSSD